MQFDESRMTKSEREVFPDPASISLLIAQFNNRRDETF